MTLLNRGNIDDGFGDRIKRIQCDRTDPVAMRTALSENSWDLVYDQVCFDYKTAKEASQLFRGKVKRYIYTSSQSVYEPGPDLVESAFAPENHKFEKEEKRESNYAEAKRQAEVGFQRHANFPIAFVRFPIVIGLDDYTKRFEFHIERIKNEKPIFFPDIDAHISFITSDFAAEVLANLSETNLVGPINAASSQPISLRHFTEIIEKFTGKKMIQAEQLSDENLSPYGIEEDWFMNCEKLNGLGLKDAEITDWLPKFLQ